MLALLGRRGAGLARAGRAPQHSAFALVRAIATGASHGLNVLFVGSDDFSADVLGRLEQYSRNKTTAIGVLEVLCQKPFVRFGDNAKVTRVPTHQIAANRGLQPHLYDTQNGFWWTVPQPKGEEAGRFDIGVVCTGAPTLPQAFVDGFPMGVVMVHPSLLPKYRGDNPIQSAILAGESETGVSVVEYSATHEFGGRLLAQVPHELDPGMMYADVKSGLAHLGGELLAKVLHNLDFVRSQAVEQDESKAVYTRPMEDCRSRKIVWESMSATDIFNIFRA
ncbi:Methionyl-tRNA formyltransferase, partial [Coemansia helicoidea]